MGIGEKALGLGGNRLRRTKLVTVTIGEGAVTFELRQPTIADRDKMLAETDLGKRIVASVIACAFDPETGERAFKSDAKDVLLEQPANSWVDELGKVALELVKPVEVTEQGKG